MTSETRITFHGFLLPEQNWSKLPHELINALPSIHSLAELKVILYVLRHTWGFAEFEIAKRITLDEFMHGRKMDKGDARMDGGTGLSKETVIDGLRRAVSDGFLMEEQDGSDKGRTRKFYMLRLYGSEKPTPGVGKADTRGRKTRHRTEKETKERNSKKESEPVGTDVSSVPEIDPKTDFAEIPNAHGLLFDAFLKELDPDMLPDGGVGFSPYMRFMKQLVKAGRTEADLQCAARLYHAWWEAHTERPILTWSVGEGTIAIRGALGLCKRGKSEADIAKYVTAVLDSAFYRQNAITYLSFSKVCEKAGGSTQAANTPPQDGECRWNTTDPLDPFWEAWRGSQWIRE